jgi:type II secretory pathway pseudopilin PulG
VRAVNLIPAEQRAGGGPVAGESQGAAFLVLGLLAGLAVLAGLYGLAARQVSSRQGEVTSITAQAQATQARANALSPYVTFKGMYQQRQAALNELVNTRFDWAHAFHELGRVLPQDASLSSVKGTIGSATATVGAASATPSKTASAAVSSATPPGTIPTFVLAGCTTSQSETAQTIQRLRLIDGVSSVTLQSSTRTASGAGGGSSGSGGCPTGDAAFALTVTFAALPAPPAASSALPGASASPTASGGGTPVSNTTTRRPQ